MANIEYKVPTFAPGPVKKEIMLCLLGLSLDEQDIRYYEYTDGVVSGCNLVEDNMKIGLNLGVVKFAGRLYKLREKVLIPYEHTDSWSILKLRFSPQIPHREYTHFTAELVLDTDLDIKPNEMEMGRFKLKKGSRLRTEYKDFWDMATEYDTVNLIHLNYSARQRSTISHVITTHFAREAFPHLSDNALDCAFCTCCLSGGEGVSRELIESYIANRLGREHKELDNVALHSALCEVLSLITGRARTDMGKGRGRGVMLIN